MIKRESPLSCNQQQKVGYAINGFPRASKWLLLCHPSIQINQEMIYHRDSEERCRKYVFCISTSGSQKFYFFLCFYIVLIYISMYFQVKKDFFILNCKLRRQGLHELKVLGKNYIKKHGCPFLSMAN
jgi:hypothetical protein